MRLLGMAAALDDQLQTPDVNSLGFEERFGLLVDREQTDRDTRRLKTRLTQARFRQQAGMEDIDFGGNRGLDKAQLPVDKWHRYLEDRRWRMPSWTVSFTSLAGWS